MKNEIATQVENSFYREIADLLLCARSKSYVSVNVIMVETYWQIGKRIVEEEQHGENRAGYGEYLIVHLSRYLTDLLGKGFSEANIRNFRQFYLKFPQFNTQCVANLNVSWTSIRSIMRLDNEVERNWYLREVSKENWSSRTLERNIKTGYYKRILSSQRQKASVVEVDEKPMMTDFIKDPYVLEFLNLPENIEGKETLLEKSLISNLQKFLLELGKGFSFVARQMRISTETDDFYLDLVFYNYLLKCFVVIDLKTAKLTHQDIGQMDMYVRMFDALKRGVDDNPTIGIIFCTDKSETMVKYSVLNENKQIFASKYKTVLPTEEELSQLMIASTTRLLETRKSK